MHQLTCQIEAHLAVMRSDPEALTAAYKQYEAALPPNLSYCPPQDQWPKLLNTLESIIQEPVEDTYFSFVHVSICILPS
jgi:hypothetical protein